GSVGSKSGFSTVIVRNKKGREIFENALRKNYLYTTDITIENLESIKNLERIKMKKAKK
ncbi:MAG: Coenzyme F420 hydrogenase/dehydrogenase, beta subunit C-terminal domain, partial [Candidatus Helarchaeota archaeon]